MPDPVTGYIDPATGQLVFDEDVGGEIVQRIAIADEFTGQLWVEYGGTNPTSAVWRFPSRPL